MRKVLLAVAAVAVLTSCAKDTVVIDTVKTDTGKCSAIVHYNRVGLADYDRTYNIPCEITTATNVMEE